jgi:hypothetical protein
MWTLALSALFAAAVTSGPLGVDFPGPVHAVVAPDGSGAQIYYRPHLVPDGGQAHPVFFDDGRSHRQRIATVTRNMTVAWSWDSRHVYLQDNLGSDLADCYALTRTTAGVRGVSLLKRIQRAPGRPKGRERPYRSHYYVSCEGWNAKGQITGSVSGHTDASPPRDFSQAFVFDPDTHKISWRR